MTTILKPQEGPQTKFLSTPADICIYGGGAGGGKSFGLLLTPLRYKNVPGFGCTVFRKNFNQIFSQGGLWDTSVSIYGGIRGAVPKPNKGEWQFTDKDGTVISKVTFAHIERDVEVLNWQGTQIAELCCEENTPILMADMSYKAIKDIRIGDSVMTLQGARKVTKIGKRKLKPCVKIKTKLGEQICTTDHKVLTSDGWLSYDDIIHHKQDSGVSALESIQFHSYQESCEQLLKKFRGNDRLLKEKHFCLMRNNGVSEQGLHHQERNSRFLHIWNAFPQTSICEPNLYDSLQEYEKYFQKIFQVDKRLHGIQYSDFLQEPLAYLSTLGHQALREIFSYKEEQGQENCFGLFADLPQVHGKPFLFRLSQERQIPIHELFEDIFCRVQFLHEFDDALKQKQFEDLKCRYLSCTHQYGEQSHLCLDNGQCYAQQQPCVAVYAPICLQSGASGNTPKHNHYQLLYEHPYTGEVLLSEEKLLDISLDTITFTPVSDNYVIDITVDDCNQYITKCGLVNKNCFDELTHFSKKVFFYMLSRNRSACGVKPFVRATCNPDSDSWVAEFIDWWIDPVSGYPIPERSGKLRWFIQRDEVYHWADTKEELWERFNLATPIERDEPRSVTFIMSLLTDNKALLDVNPSYMANLKALPEIERERLLMGNWKIKAAAGMFFKRTQLGSVLNVVPLGVQQWVRCWDLAATEKTPKGDPAYTAGVLIGKQANGRYLVADVINRQMAAVDVRKTIAMTAEADVKRYGRVRIRLPRDPGQAGKEQAETYIKMLAGYDVTTVIESGSKETRAEPVAAQWQAGNFDIVAGAWNEPFLYQLENFPDGKFKDMVDAFANGFTELENKNTFNLRYLI